MHMPDSTLCQEPKQPKLLDQVRQYLRLHHYSIHTERSYMEGNVAPATQNQAMNALVFLYKRVLRQAMEGSINAVRADKKVNVPASNPPRASQNHPVADILLDFAGNIC